MRQLFIQTSEASTAGFENQDAFPVSERLISEFETRFLSVEQDGQTVFKSAAPPILSFLNDFYAQYELAEPQRRVLQRLERILRAQDPAQPIGLIAVDVSAHRSRRQIQKI